MSSVCQKFVVSGRVQMVGFRYHTAHQGLKFGLTGYAKNLNDGRVEVMACGERQAIEALDEWLKVGPKTSTVADVVKIETAFRHYSDFKIL
uniref:acylphosphatase n=1 Tax=Vibrio rarus TaxID=413403 RepID=UPI0021C32723|nr:acylphosphatase [Vibrio rarus]